MHIATTTNTSTTSEPGTIEVITAAPAEACRLMYTLEDLGWTWKADLYENSYVLTGRKTPLPADGPSVRIVWVDGQEGPLRLNRMMWSNGQDSGPVKTLPDLVSHVKALAILV